jgi:hypothetical protein
MRRTRQLLMTMRIPARHGHYLFGAMQSGLTSLVASGIASRGSWNSGDFLQNWLHSWLYAWMVILPVVLLAAPFLRTAVARITREGPLSDSHMYR